MRPLIPLAVLLAACATTPGGSATGTENAATLDPAMAQDFVTDIDGAKVHPGSGLPCPAEQLGLPLRRAELVAPDGSDMSCHYHDGGTRLTWFLTSVPQRLSEKDYYAVSYGGMQEVFSALDYAVDEAATESCRESSATSESMAGDISAGLLAAQRSGDTSIDVSPGRETLVMTRGEATSLMLFDEVAPGLYLKARYTVPDMAPDAACAAVVPLFDAREADVVAVSGDPMARLLRGTEADG